MSYLSKLTSGAKRAATASKALETAEYAGASYLYGYVQNKYRDKASAFGVPADLLTGLALKAAAVACSMMGKCRSLVPHANTLGNAGLGAYAHTLGAGHGAQSSGMKKLLLKASDVDKAKKAFPDATILGDLPKAPKGDFLSAAELAALAR